MTTSFRNMILLGASRLPIGVVFCVLVGLSGCSNEPSTAGAAGQKKPVIAGSVREVRVKVIRPKRERLTRVSTPHPAHVEPYEKTEIQVKVSGFLQTVAPALNPDGKPILGRDGTPRAWDIGDRVMTGQVLAELFAPELKQEVARQAALVAKTAADHQLAEIKINEATARLAKYQAEKKYREGEYERYAALYKGEAAAKELVDKEANHLAVAEAALTAAENAVETAKANAKVEEAQLEVAKADLKYAEIMAGYTTIKAPYEGIITRRLFDTGAFIQSATSGKALPLFTLAREDRLRIVAQIPNKDAGLVKIGQTARFQQNGSKTWIGKVVRTADALDAKTRTMRVEVELNARAADLRPGTFGAIVLTLIDIPMALTIPSQALLPDHEPAVLCVDDGKVCRRQIDVGYRDAVDVQVTGGLSSDAQVIVDGKNSVREGQTVEILK